MKLKSAAKTAVISAAAVVAAIALAVLIVFNSPQAFRYLFHRFKPAGLTVSHISGTLAGPLRLEGVVYDTKKSRIGIGALEMDWRPSELFSLRVHITRISIDKMKVLIKKTKIKKRPMRLPQLRLPPFLSLHLDNLTAKGIRYLRPKAKTLFLSSLSLGASMRGPNVSIRSLRLAAPEASAVLNGRIMTLDDYPLSFNVRWAFTSQNKKYPPAQGGGSIAGSIKKLRILQKIGPPYHAAADLTLSNLRGGAKTLGWRAAVTWKQLRLPFRKKGKTILSRQGEFYSEGNERAYSFRLNGDFSLTGIPPFRISANGEGSPKSLKIERLAVFSAAAGRIVAGGRLSWSPLLFDFKIVGSEVNTSRFLKNQKLKGKVGKANFSALASGTISKGRTGITITVESFTAHLLDGMFQGKGKLSIEKHGKRPAVSRFAFKIIGNGLDAARLKPKLKGTVDFAAIASGAVSKGRRDINLDLTSLSGRLRGHPLSGKGRIRIRNKDYFIPVLVIRSGTARIFASGSRVNQIWNLSWRVDAKNLGEFLPGAGGQLSARGRLTGRGKKPFITAAISGTDTKYKKYGAKNFHGTFSVDLSGRKRSSIDLTAEGLQAGRVKVRSLNLAAAGNKTSHRIDLRAKGMKTAMALSLEGGYRRGVWKGTLAGLRITEYRYGGALGVWSLAHPTPIEVSKTEIAVALCLAKDKTKTKICLRAHMQKKVRTHLVFSASEVPLSLIHPLLPPGLAITGTLNGNADVVYAKGQFSGTADLRLSNGAFLYSLRGKKMRLTFKESVFTVRSANKTVTLLLNMPFVEGGGIAGRFVIQNIKTVSGNVQMKMPSLAIVSAVLPQANGVRGVLKAAFNVSGPLKNPAVSGQLAVQKASVSLPALGIKLTGVALSATSSGKSKNRFLIDGVVHSGPGAIGIKGYLSRSPAKIWSALLNIKGKDFLALKNPTAQVQASPDLHVSLIGRKMGITGRVDIPVAAITIKKLPSGVARPSPDVVIVGQKKVRVKAMKLVVSANVAVVLGKRITFEGFGFKGRIAGRITILETPGKVATGHGELIVNGKYKKYGQNLTVHRGRILFIGGPVDNPGLDVQATRTAQNGVIAGVRVTGTLTTPKLVVFSVPPMDETDALAYLVLGKPLHSASSSQGNLLYEAATTAGLAGGQFVAARIGSIFGITKVSVEKGPSPSPGQQQQATLFLGRYLSPRLYVAYGLGLFQTSNVVRVRYSLTRNWIIQTETGTETGGDLLWKLQW